MKNETASSSWRIRPPPIPDSQIAREYSADVIITGMGHAGITATRAAAEAGASVFHSHNWCKHRHCYYSRP